MLLLRNFMLLLRNLLLRNLCNCREPDMTLEEEEVSK